MSSTQEVRSVKGDKFLQSLAPLNVEPLWTVMLAMVPSQPHPKAIPTIWKYNEIRPLLEELGSLVPAEEAERRVLMLINPALNAPQTTDTLYAGLQYILPGEVAVAHRHSAFALRFIIEGEGGFTNVEGSRLYMEEGDVILTPRWLWHDHGKEGSGPMIWLDGLDLPIFQAIPSNFAEHYKEKSFPAEDVLESPMKYPWRDTEKYLNNVEGDYAVYDYHSKENPLSPLSTIIGAQAERINCGAESQWRQENSSFVYHSYKGSGKTILKNVDNSETIINWSQRDTFCIPSWKRFKHINTGDEIVYLFSYSDKPLLKNLNIHRVN